MRSISFGRVFSAYKYLLRILMKNIPILVVLVFATAIIYGFLTPVQIYANSNIFNIGLRIAEGKAEFSELTPFLILFAVYALAPRFIELLVHGFISQRTTLVLRSAIRGEMLNKLEKMKYSHLENEQSMEIIDKTYTRLEDAATSLFPFSAFMTLSSAAGTLGSFLVFASVKWWLVIPVFLPYFIETALASHNNYDIYKEMESYWKKERSYRILQDSLQNRDFIRENRLNQSSDYLIDTYGTRLRTRNKEYESYVFKNLRRFLLSSNFTRLTTIGTLLILLYLYLNGEMNVGLFISVSSLIFGTLSAQLDGFFGVFKWGHGDANTIDYLKQYFQLSEDEEHTDVPMPQSFDIEFRDVWFRYPDTDKDILKGLSFSVKNGEKISVVGENGEGKSTMVKLLLGLFTPDKGEIRIGGVPLEQYSREQKTQLFGTVFQDFSHFQITAKENIVIGDLTDTKNPAKFQSSVSRSRLRRTLDDLPEKENSLLGKEFEGGTDLSGGQWQRIAMARVLYADRPILILDEPTSQLDPMAESELYGEFSGIAKDKTSLFITHRLGSTAITDRIIVISGGIVAQSGSHDELLQSGGLYAEMFLAQKSWYEHEEGGAL